MGIVTSLKQCICAQKNAPESSVETAHPWDIPKYPKSHTITNKFMAVDDDNKIEFKPYVNEDGDIDPEYRRVSDAMGYCSPLQKYGIDKETYVSQSEEIEKDNNTEPKNNGKADTNEKLCDVAEIQLDEESIEARHKMDEIIEKVCAPKPQDVGNYPKETKDVNLSQSQKDVSKELLSQQDNVEINTEIYQNPKVDATLADEFEKNKIENNLEIQETDDVNSQMKLKGYDSTVNIEIEQNPKVDENDSGVSGRSGSTGSSTFSDGSMDENITNSKDVIITEPKHSVTQNPITIHESNITEIVDVENTI